jgi:hypothetical protein
VPPAKKTNHPAPVALKGKGLATIARPTGRAE